MDTPLCDCHCEPMLWNRKNERRSGGSWVCRIRNRERARRYYAANPEPQLARSRARYEANALPKLMRKQLTHHRKRLAELEEQVDG